MAARTENHSHNFTPRQGKVSRNDQGGAFQGFYREKVSENKIKSEFLWAFAENFRFYIGFVDDYQGNIVYLHKNIGKICELGILYLILHPLSSIT